MTESFVPMNELEEKLLATHQGELQTQQFLDALLGEQVFMPILEKSDIGGLQTSKSAHPLTLQTEDGLDVIIAFSSPERAKTFVKDFPGYGGGLLTEFSWILEHLSGRVGVSINPDHEMGIDLDPEMMDELARKHAAANASNPND